jgi:hypothetical protein
MFLFGGGGSKKSKKDNNNNSLANAINNEDRSMKQ